MNLYRTFIPTEAERMEGADERAWEALREECGREFDEWRGLDWRNREFADFSDWLVRMAQPHMRDHQRYQAAMNWHERARIEMSSIARGHRQFNREFGK